MKNYESLSHTRYDCKYHVVSIPKYRRKKIYGAIRRHLGEIFHELAKQKESRILEGHLKGDHVHMCISIPPKFAVSSVVGFMKGKSAISIARNFLGRKRNFTGESFWARGYFVSTVGLDEEVVREYIRQRLCHWQRCIRARLRNAFFTAAWRPLPPSMITSRPWEISSPRSSSERRNGVNTCAFSVSVSTKPKKRFSPEKRNAQRHNHRGVGETSSRLETAPPHPRRIDPVPASLGASSRLLQRTLGTPSSSTARWRPESLPLPPRSCDRRFRRELVSAVDHSPHRRGSAPRTTAAESLLPRCSEPGAHGSVPPFRSSSPRGEPQTWGVSEAMSAIWVLRTRRENTVQQRDATLSGGDLDPGPGRTWTRTC